MKTGFICLYIVCIIHLNITTGFANPEESFLDPQFPFHKLTFTMPGIDKNPANREIIPRAIVLKPGHNFYACFDTDLLRWATFWKGQGLHLNSLAPGSYSKQNWSSKSRIGTADGNSADGKVIYTLSTFAGLSSGNNTWQDPRAPHKTLEKIGMGPLSHSIGRWKKCLLTSKSPVLYYTYDQVDIEEWIESPHPDLLIRHVKCKNIQKDLFLHITDQKGEQKSSTQIQLPNPSFPFLHMKILSAESACQWVVSENGTSLKVPSRLKDVQFSVVHALNEESLKQYLNDSSGIPSTPNRLTHSKNKKIKLHFPQKKESFPFFSVTHLPVPDRMTQARNVRLSGITSDTDGKLILCTFDGDIWAAKVEFSKKTIEWQRIAGGFDEPQSLAAHNGHVYIYDRSGITKLTDVNDDGWMDIYENFCNLMIQSAESREFPMDMKMLNDGRMIIATGGQRAHSSNPHAGTIIEISTDGRDIKILGMGLREPYLGVDPTSSLILASDQQGHYVPATPIHHIVSRAYYGYMPYHSKTHPFPIQPPLTWIPHHINPSAGGLLKLPTKQFGLLSNQWLVMNFTTPGLGFFIYDQETPLNSFYSPSKVTFPYPVLKATIHGQKNNHIFITGFNLWGSSAKGLTGISLLSPKKIKHPLPSKMSTYKNGILLIFENAIKEEGLGKDNFSIESWDYLRTANYGSAHYKKDKSHGHQIHQFQTLSLSPDKKQLWLGINDMHVCDQMSLSYDLEWMTGDHIKETVFFTVHHLETAPDSTAFKSLQLQNPTKPKPISNNENGQMVFLKYGCSACHATQTNEKGKAGPSLFSIFGRKRETNKGPVLVDEAYLRESILDAQNRIAKGFKAEMASYRGIIPDKELEALVHFIKSLR